MLTNFFELILFSILFFNLIPPSRTEILTPCIEPISNKTFVAIEKTRTRNHDKRHSFTGKKERKKCLFFFLTKKACALHLNYRRALIINYTLFFLVLLFRNVKGTVFSM